MLKIQTKPLHVESIEGGALARNAELFLSTDFTTQLHVFALCADSELYQHQFQGFDWLSSEQDPVLSLVGIPKVGEGHPTVPLAVFPKEITPSRLESIVTSMPVLTITTLSLLQDQGSRKHLFDLERSFVVIDQPLLRQIQRWTESGWSTRFVVAKLKRDQRLSRITLTVDELPRCLFVGFGTTDALNEFSTIACEDSDLVVSNLVLRQAVGAEVDAVSAQLLRTWWTIPEAP